MMINDLYDSAQSCRPIPFRKYFKTTSKGMPEAPAEVFHVKQTDQVPHAE